MMRAQDWDIYEQRELLLLDTRQRILEAIYKKPGLHFRELARATGLATGQLEYHLYRLEKAGLIHSEKDGKYTRYYPPLEYSDDVKQILKLLNRPRVKEIVEYLAENECATVDELEKVVGLARSSVVWHLKRLEEYGIVLQKKGKYSKRYTLKNIPAAIQALKIHREGLLDTLAKRLAEMWEW
jgi:predicted transcriptional regulator